MERWGDSQCDRDNLDAWITREQPEGEEAEMDVHTERYARAIADKTIDAIAGLTDSLGPNEYNEIARGVIGFLEESIEPEVQPCNAYLTTGGNEYRCTEPFRHEGLHRQGGEVAWS